MKSEVRLVLSTFPDRDTALRIAASLVESGHAACVNIVPGVTSVFKWEGKTEITEEVLAIFKTAPATLEPMMEKLAELHPYDVPEILAININAGADTYMEWIHASCDPAPTRKKE